MTCRDWTNYSLNANMQRYANELLQSMCDVVLEGSTSYLGLATTFLSPAQSVQITGSTYTTGWEGGGISNPQIVSGGSGYAGTMTYTITGSGGWRRALVHRHRRRDHLGLGVDPGQRLHRRGDSLGLWQRGRLRREYHAPE